MQSIYSARDEALMQLAELELELEDDGLEKLQELYDVPFFHLS